MGITASVPLYTIEDVPGKGKGLIATKDIPKGTRIISEKPLLTSGQHVADMSHLELRIYEQVCTLSTSQQHTFHSLSNIYPHTNPLERWRGIFRTNALPMGPDLDIGGVFPTASRLNHACAPNAQNFWNDNLNELTIHAVCAIPAGEEITITYLHAAENQAARQDELRRNFKFECACRLCSLPPDDSRKSDEILDRIHELDSIIDGSDEIHLVLSAPRLLHPPPPPHRRTSPALAHFRSTHASARRRRALPRIPRCVADCGREWGFGEGKGVCGEVGGAVWDVVGGGLSRGGGV
jgi:hypothetical protein